MKTFDRLTFWGLVLCGLFMGCVLLGAAIGKML